MKRKSCSAQSSEASMVLGTEHPRQVKRSDRRLDTGIGIFAAFSFPIQKFKLLYVENEKIMQATT